jgi:hypothetical protein
MIFIKIFHNNMKPCDTNRQVTTQKIKWYKDMIKSIAQHSYCEKKPHK